MQAEQKVRILIVDDDVDAANGVKDLLEMEGHVIGVAHDGNGAMQSAMMMSPQVALVDLRLKGEWGLDVAQELKAKFPDIVNVVMTGESDSGVVIAALRQGVYEYLTKPFEPDEMVHVIKRAAEKIGYETQRREIMDELKRARDQAELASRSKTEFLTRMGGEIGRQFGDLVDQASSIAEQRMGSIENEDYLQLAGGIADGCRRLSRVMTWIGELGHLEAGSMRIEKSDFELAGLIEGITSVFYSALSEKNLELELDFAEDLPIIHSDANHFARILGHLLTNSIKFSTADSKIQVSAMVDGFGDLRIGVRDSGIGMDAKDIDLALAPFGRIAPNEDSDPYSVGLGLPLADKFTSLLGGKMSIESTPGQGTSIELRFSKDRVLDGASAVRMAS